MSGREEAGNVRTEFDTKLARIRSYLDQSGRNAAVIGRRDNFAWLTGGGDNTVLRNSELGFSLLVVTAHAVYHVAQIMDGPRILEEELQGLGAEPVYLRWYEQSRDDKAVELMGRGCAAADIPVHGTDFVPRDITSLHYPLTDQEMERCRVIGDTTDRIITRVANAVRPGMREREIEAMLLSESAKEGMACDVLLIGSDERISRFRHPTPSDKTVDRLVLLAPVLRKWGLHAAVSRMLFFGDTIPVDVAARFHAVCRIEAAAISMSVPGTPFASILDEQKRLYMETGFADEWRNHYQGGITGYTVSDASLCMDPRARVSSNQSFAWFITITGVKVEELALSGPAGFEIPSAHGSWPLAEFEYRGARIRLPQILQR